MEAMGRKGKAKKAKETKEKEWGAKQSILDQRKGNGRDGNKKGNGI